MTKFKPIAMRCNQQQYAEIKQILIDNNFKMQLNGSFDNYPYLVNNDGGYGKNILNIREYCTKDYNRTVFETWNKDTFLEYCGIETKEDFKVGDWVVITEIDAKKLGYDSWGNSSSKYKIGDVVKLIEDKGNWGADKNRVVKWWFTTKDSSCGIVSALFRKAEFHEIPNVVYLKCISSIEPHNFTVGKIYFVNDLRFTSNTGFTYNKARSIHDFYPSYFTWELSTKEAYDIQEGIKSTYYPEIGDWVFTDMCNVKDALSKETCVKVRRIDLIPGEQPNFLVETESGGSLWCYPSKRNTSFVRKAEPHEIPNGKVPELLPPDYVEAVRNITGIEKGKIYPFVNGCVIDGRYNNYEMPLNEGCSYFKPSTKEAYDKQNVQNTKNAKNDYIVGKWYKFSSYSENTNVNYAKLKELDNDFTASDWIIRKSYEGTAKWSLDHIFNPVLLTDLSEIQQYLPDGHVDKMPVKVKEPDLHDLLVEATKRYPIGSTVKCLTNGNPELIETDFTVYHDMIIQDNKDKTRVYKNGNWAEILEPAKPVEIKSKYRIAAEEAMKKFSDIKIGDLYITTNGDKYEATRLPEIVADSNEDCYVDCGPGYLWEYETPHIVGYKVIKSLTPIEETPIISLNDLYESPSMFHALDYKETLKEIQPTESITNQLLNIKLNNY
jgi:hypothetical protein